MVLLGCACAIRQYFRSRRISHVTGGMRAVAAFLLALCLALSANGGKKFKVDPKKSKVYGPGLTPHRIVYPARYFFIEAHDMKGNR